MPYRSLTQLPRATGRDCARPPPLATPWHPGPSTGETTARCPGYVIDHIRPLKERGADDPANMQWQTKEAAKQKDKWE